MQYTVQGEGKGRNGILRKRQRQTEGEVERRAEERGRGRKKSGRERERECRVNTAQDDVAANRALKEPKFSYFSVLTIDISSISCRTIRLAYSRSTKSTRSRNPTSNATHLDLTRYS